MASQSDTNWSNQAYKKWYIRLILAVFSIGAIHLILYFCLSLYLNVLTIMGIALLSAAVTLIIVDKSEKRG